MRVKAVIRWPISVAATTWAHERIVKMTTRGKTIKHDTPEALSLLRPMITRRYELLVDHGKCCSCKICELVCPQEAITLSEVELVEGRVVVTPRVDIDDALCNFCGECVAMCPTHALSMTVNSQPEVPVLKGEAFPMLIRTMKVEQAPCEATADTAYIDDCPVEAISADIEQDQRGQVVSVRNVSVDKEVCINCTHCMEEGPKGGFTVTKPYKGRAFLNTALCPEGCQACVDVCPTPAMTYDGQKVALDKRFCLFCGACEKVCPVEGAIRILRTGFVHTPIESAAWTDALEKLVSYRVVIQEHDIKGQKKRRQLVFDGLLLGVNPDESK